MQLTQVFSEIWHLIFHDPVRSCKAGQEKFSSDTILLSFITFLCNSLLFIDDDGFLSGRLLFLLNIDLCFASHFSLCCHGNLTNCCYYIGNQYNCLFLYQKIFPEKFHRWVEGVTSEHLFFEWGQQTKHIRKCVRLQRHVHRDGQPNSTCPPQLGHLLFPTSQVNNGHIIWRVFIVPYP